ncbi:MAG: hypothetical protein Q9162_006328 [Coniocarpon cinnabarinum]
MIKPWRSKVRRERLVYAQKLRPGYVFPVRRASTRVVNNSGHIDTNANEGVVFFNKDPRARLIDPVQIFNKAIEARGKKGAATVESLTPLVRDGGAFLKFSHSSDTSKDDIIRLVRDHQANNKTHPWWNPFDETLIHAVRGRPWIEDLYRPPSSRVKVEFEPEGTAGGSNPELSQEQVYSLLRPYGKLQEIQSQPTDSKIWPRYTLVDFASTSSAITAKNCLHGFVVNDEEGAGKGLVIRLKTSYERYSRSSWATDWLFNHPRIVIPALAALGAFIASVVFDPIRTTSIKLHITRALHISDNKIVKMIMSRTNSILNRYRDRDEDAGASYLNAIWTDRKNHIETLEKWLMETADTFIVVQGPRGSGKRDLVVTQALKSRPNKLVIDCKRIQDARGDAATINAAADAVGYWPVFSWMNSMSGLIDLAAQSATGVKAGFSETLDGQLSKILGNTAGALREIALQDRDKKKDKDASIADDDYLEAHPEKRAVVVIDNFLHRANSADASDTVVYDKLADWAADLVEANIAHVIFLTTDVSFAKSLSKALPDRVFRQISLGDLPADAAKRFVVSHLDAEPEDVSEDGDKAKKLTPYQRRKDLGELDDCVDALGGRLTDLEYLSRRIRSGETPSAAVKGIIEQSASEILKMYILGSRTSAEEQAWTPSQAWVLVKALAEAMSGSLKYNELLLHDCFGSTSGPAVLAALEQAELITVRSRNGRPYEIRAGKPVYLEAFRMLRDDEAMQARMDTAIVAEQMKAANAGIDKAEEELKLLGSLPNVPAELKQRVRYLCQKIEGGQRAVEELEATGAELKAVLRRAY